MFDKEEEKETTKLIVSDEFVEIYKNFNICDQIERMKNLDKRELYLLLILCLDRHNEDDYSVVKYNYKPFIEEIKEILDVQDNKGTKVTILLDLIKETNHEHIESDVIVDMIGNPLPDPYSKQEVRDKKLDIINNI